MLWALPELATPWGGTVPVHDGAFAWSWQRDNDVSDVRCSDWKTISNQVSKYRSSFGNSIPLCAVCGFVICWICILTCWLCFWGLNLEAAAQGMAGTQRAFFNLLAARGGATFVWSWSGMKWVEWDMWAKKFNPQHLMAISLIWVCISFPLRLVLLLWKVFQNTCICTSNRLAAFENEPGYSCWLRKSSLAKPSNVLHWWQCRRVVLMRNQEAYGYGWTGWTVTREYEMNWNRLRLWSGMQHVSCWLGLNEQVSENRFDIS